ncbi:hypothetical protein HanRHA438_Chr16g0747241 [Helianthus annuus]|nr:hypothetical protein HanIR_Chr16g0799161 [Helianthus annuus]KAJ0834753.1 hypothetical protein HanRHA438_Chr16g0747241 [Helianthus annuus]
MRREMRGERERDAEENGRKEREREKGSCLLPADGKPSNRWRRRRCSTATVAAGAMAASVQASSGMVVQVQGFRFGFRATAAQVRVSFRDVFEHAVQTRVRICLDRDVSVAVLLRISSGLIRIGSRSGSVNTGQRRSTQSTVGSDLGLRAILGSGAIGSVQPSQLS